MILPSTKMRAECMFMITSMESVTRTDSFMGNSKWWQLYFGKLEVLTTSYRTKKPWISASDLCDIAVSGCDWMWWFVFKSILSWRSLATFSISKPYYWVIGENRRLHRRTLSVFFLNCLQIQNCLTCIIIQVAECTSLSTMPCLSTPWPVCKFQATGISLCKTCSLPSISDGNNNGQGGFVEEEFYAK